jgi:ABC-type Mn2+/Zn2+ transport system permease subunit
MGFITVGLALSFQYDLPSGPVIIVLAGISYFGCLLTMCKR